MELARFSNLPFPCGLLTPETSAPGTQDLAGLLAGLEATSALLLDLRAGNPPGVLLATRTPDGALHLAQPSSDRSTPLPNSEIVDTLLRQSPDAAFDAAFVWGDLPESPEVKTAFLSRLSSCRRLAKRSLLLQVPLSPGQTRSTWEADLLQLGFRKHPLDQALTPFESRESESGSIQLLFERIPDAALARFPLERLAAERDLHMDMLREPGLRSEAHLARYLLAREHLRPGMTVVDAACGLGYGCAILAAGTGVARIFGVDCSPFAIEYAAANYPSFQPRSEYRVGDATRLAFLAEASVDVVVSFETLEHLVDPDALLREFARILKPGGLFIGSVPNLWVDEQGRNPVPFHLHIYDHAQFQRQLERYFEIVELHRQNAGGGWKRPQPRTLRRLENSRPTSADQRDAEWWITVSRKPAATTSPSPSTPASPASPTTAPGPLNPATRIVVLDEPARHYELFGKAFEQLGVQPELAPSISPEDLVASKPDLVVLSREWTRAWRLTAAAARRAGIPVVYVMDGVLEWSYVWNNLSHIRGEGTMLQPLVASDLCVIGQHPARLLASLGLGPRIHIVGLPRFDRYDRSRRLHPTTRPRIVIATARTAGHNVEQQMMVRRALRDLHSWFSANPGVADPVWRIAADLAEDLGVQPDIHGSLADTLTDASALVSFPSTCVLEGLLKGLPVAQIDYRAVPAYVATAWEIRSADQIPGVLQELIYPPPARLAYQDACLSDELELGDASSRLAEVLREALLRGQPHRDADQTAPLRPRGQLDYRQIHSELSAFAASPASLLQYELDAAYDLVRRVKQERMEQRRQLLEFAESVAEADLDQLRQYAFLDHFSEAELESESPGSASVGTLAHAGQSVRTLFLNPPARLTFLLPVGAPGKLTFAVSLHPAVWNNPESGACRFLLDVDGESLCDATLDAAHVETDRRWFRFDVPVAENAAGTHRVVFRTEGLGSNAFRWALWRNPIFTWAIATTPESTAPTSPPTRTVRPLTVPDFYQPGRTIP